MTIDRETVIRLAVEAGIKLGPAPDRIHLGTYVPDDISFSLLQRFTNLVLEHGHKPLTLEQIAKAMHDAGWPPSMVSRFVQAKLDAFARAVEAAHGITNKESSDAERRTD